MPETARQPASGSKTQTQTTSSPRVLRLRGRHNATGRSVQWADDVIDNEGLGRKSSKVCCIYHKPKAVDESSDESSSSSSDQDSDDGRDHGDKCGHGHARDKKKGRKRQPSPNAYEKVPKQKPKEDASKAS